MSFSSKLFPGTSLAMLWLIRKSSSSKVFKQSSRFIILALRYVDKKFPNWLASQKLSTKAEEEKINDSTKESRISIKKK